MRLNQVKEDHLDFVRSGALYQIFPDRFARDESVPADRPLVPWDSEPTRENFFGGNLRGVQGKLDHLRELGVGNLYFNPIFRAPSNHRYDTENYFEIEPLIGTNEDLRSLTSAAKARDIGVIVDGVFNHCGRTMPEFQAALAGDQELAKMFHIYPDGSYQTFGGTEFMPKLNTAEPLVLDFVERVLRHWHEYGIAGWRFDVPYKFADGFMRQLRERTKDLSSARYFIAEAWNEWSFATDFEAVQNYRTGYRIQDYVHKHAADAEDFILDIMRWCAGWSDFSVLPNFIDSHDTARFATLVGGREDSWQLGFALHMLVPGVPVVFAGTELAMQGENDPGCRVSYPAVLNEQQAKAMEFSKPWMQLRHDSKALTHGGLEVVELKNHAMIFERRFDNERITVLVNTGWHDELLYSNIEGDWVDMHQKPVTLGDRVPQRSLFYRVG
ncbi:MAG: alpha-amylase family glycosyl hydrolase [Micrococcales bacterium]